ncbi:hypothetical protein NL676_028780 [Syzygium grande]|nr:hypothetical protein NL676_028780 [Syzygium grande]
MNGGEEAASGGGHVEGTGLSVGFCEPGSARILISSISTVDGGTGVIFRRSRSRARSGRAGGRAQGRIGTKVGRNLLFRLAALKISVHYSSAGPGFLAEWPCPTQPNIAFRAHLVRDGLFGPFGVKPMIRST